MNYFFNKRFISGLILVLILSLNAACVKEEITPIAEKDSITTARAVFENKRIASREKGTKDLFLRIHLDEIDWEAAAIKEKGNKLNLFVPLASQGDYVVADAEQNNGHKLIMQLKASSQNQGKDWQFELVTYIPEAAGWSPAGGFIGTALMEDWFEESPIRYAQFYDGKLTKNHPMLRKNLIMGLETTCYMTTYEYYTNGRLTHSHSTVSCKTVYNPDYSGPEEWQVPNLDDPGGGGGEEVVPINLKRYVISEEIRDKYKKFASLVDGIEDFLKANDEVLDALVTFTGFSRSEILNIAKSGNGPEIKLIEDPLYKNSNGVFMRKGDTNVIYINESNLRNWEERQSRHLPPQSQFNGFAFSIMVTILHETVHYGRFHNNFPDPKHPDQGTLFEHEAFGFNVQYNIDQPVQYILYFK